MDKKTSNRSNQSSGKGLISEAKKNQDASGGKQGLHRARQRESPNISSSKGELPNRINKSGATKARISYEKRPRARGSGYGTGGGTTGEGGANNATSYSGTNENGPRTRLEDSEDELKADIGLFEMDSTGSKKQNLNHLLNFHYAPRSNDPQMFSRTGNNRGFCLRRTKYNKEQYLQANCQFVVTSTGDYSSCMVCPDTLVDWTLIEQINIFSAEQPQCPICLFPPVAGKMTRCGHVFCWPCILHYLALSDKTWRNCPICYEPVHLADLKSAISQPFPIHNIGDMVTLQLMSREKNTLFVSKRDAIIANLAPNIPHLFDTDGGVRHTKLILANSQEIMSIIERERNELDNQILCDGIDSPESVFIEQAFVLLLARQDLLKTIKEPVLEKKKEIMPTRELIERMGDLKLKADNESDLVVGVENQLAPTEEMLSNYFYYYQAIDGQQLFLHSINYRMLQKAYGSLEQGPTIIRGRILQKETLSMSEEMRSRLKYLQHLPISCQFDVVEIQFEQQIMPTDILELFNDELMKRRKMRQRRAREERVREQFINAANDRQMGKLLTETANINIGSSKQFPMVSEPSLNHADADPQLDGRTASSYQQDLNENSPPRAGPSFATMLGQPKTDFWPILSPKETGARPKLIHVSGGNVSSSIASAGWRATRPLSESDDMDEDESYARPPAYQNNLSSAIAAAIENASSKSSKKVRGDGNGKKKRKNQNFTLLQ